MTFTPALVSQALLECDKYDTLVSDWFYVEDPALNVLLWQGFYHLIT
ncbi:hypothetical protein [Prochlorococcus sp. MIT 1300]|nr:hypothetical protein [Prochlorococcus sp. MIT 1300]